MNAGKISGTRLARTRPLAAAKRVRPAELRVFVADPYPTCIEGVATELSRHEGMVLAGSALTWAEATSEVADLAPDVALIEDSLAGSCTAAVEALGSLGSDPSVVFLSDSVETASVYEAMAVAAAGYLTRDAGADVVVRALRDASDGRTVLTPELQTKLAEEIRLRVTGEGVPFSPRERRTLQLIADGMRTREIAGALKVSRATVKSDVSSILGGEARRA
jgi:DNA-binding NarL/FixJ family response regulator